MKTLTVETYENQKAYRPGEPIDGLVTWAFDRPPESIEVHLLWVTAGKGDTDIGVVDRRRIDRPNPQDAEAFTFTAPLGPHSFSGRLISLTWFVEAVVEKDRKLAGRVEITIGPGGEEVKIGLGRRTANR